MPPIPRLQRAQTQLVEWSQNKRILYEQGVELVKKFCKVNKVQEPPIICTSKSKWFVSACAYYRPDTEKNRKWTTPGINICLEHCGTPCSEAQSRNWTWPGSTTDREPYGVLAHELGHHCDWLASERRGTYFGDYGVRVHEESGEEPISGYHDNVHEWFAEMFRVFVTNSNLLKRLRPRTYTVLSRRWQPVIVLPWRVILGKNVPARVIKSLEKKGAK